MSYRRRDGRARRTRGFKFMKRARPDDEGVAAQQAARPHTVTRPGTRSGAAAPSPSRGGGGEFVEDLSFLAGDVLGAFLSSFLKLLSCGNDVNNVYMLNCYRL